MKSIEELNNKLETILLLYINAKVFYLDAYYLYNAETVEEKKVAHFNEFIYRSRIAIWRSAILDLSKLFIKSKNEHFNLIDFLKSLISDYEDNEWKHKFPKPDLNKWLGKIEEPEILKIRENLKTNRDKRIAHNDKGDEEIRMTFKELRPLLDIAEKLIHDLYSKFFDTEQEFEVKGSDKADNILRIIIEWNEYRKKDNLEKALDNKNKG